MQSILDRTYYEFNRFNFKIILLSWLGFIGFDLFLHAGLLAKLYHEDNPAILPPLDAFYLIPVGYFAFFLYCVFLYWLILTTKISDRIAIIKFSVMVGVFLGIASTLAQVSILQVNELLLIGWGIGFIIEIFIAGTIIAYALTGYSHKKLFYLVILFDFALFIITVVMQNIGLAPPLETALKISFKSYF